MFLHILGSDISHHNYTVLAFFERELLPQLPSPPHFFVVGNETLRNEFPTLELTIFSNQKALAKAVTVKAKQDPMIRFFFHGQYNVWLWFAILFGKLPLEQCYWHIWGADLYETSKNWRFRLFYPVRRLAQKRLMNICGTAGDLYYFSKINPQSNRLLLYFPTKMPDKLPIPKAEIDSHFTLLLGNSGDKANQHLLGLRQLKLFAKRNVEKAVKIIIPMGYPQGNQAYIETVAQVSEKLFTKKVVQLLSEKLPFDVYLEQLAQCDFGVFPFERQQGVGTICLLIALNIPFALSRKNPFCIDLISQNIPFLYVEEIAELSYDQIAEIKRQLQQLDKSLIHFFPKNYVKEWLEILCK
ncbi:hypothetical protein A6B43_05170 [Vespertiliibacter pulmonis]|uniref:dTDP-N-acetylfucosamine:lipid II N-acetylfucosaminyltransferase n=1 Tax=Vespertiliibacter pulmonis TaxID=1443036 RepID=A0A3N4VKH6_9PAST|nr:TDP-N-acetylfucosamine:lipid II N-acetylfucosaminyltransferase [Vespertiliibacter pulmonis]QLB20956.1 hypothetical protein A6B43_05170 [Vespertiliibacter pulmonis]RPE83616.1 dTDP-N-acetylfucosamine:lipid II N-acetylfucosaminyltransferase [Vespertiliibacter pulmonis]